MKRRFPSPLLALGSALAGLLLAASGAAAQVIEIGADGAVAVYDRPTVFTEQGARAITPPASLRATTAAPSAPVGQVRAAINEAARRAELSPRLIEAVARQESGFRHQAVSRAGAVGVMQLMPGTAAELGVDRFDLSQNVTGGATYLRRMLDSFNGDLSLALAAYNAGPAAVRRFGGVPPFGETRAYVSAILGRLALNAVTPEVAP
jgi:soluble lytic murein transglycosylase-like protein